MKFTAIYADDATPVKSIQKAEEATLHERLAALRAAGDKRRIVIFNDAGKIVAHAEP